MSNEIDDSLRILNEQLKPLEFAEKLSKFQVGKTDRHPFSREVFSLTCLLKDLDNVKALPDSRMKRNLIVKMDLYLNEGIDLDLYKDLIVETINKLKQTVEMEEALVKTRSTPKLLNKQFPGIDWTQGIPNS
jgi:hypothetical protein